MLRAATATPAARRWSSRWSATLFLTATLAACAACGTAPIRVTPTRCIRPCLVTATYIYRGTIPVHSAAWSLGRCTSTQAATLSQTHDASLGHAFHASCVLAAGIWYPSITLYSESGARILRETASPVTIGVTDP